MSVREASRWVIFSSTYFCCFEPQAPGQISAASTPVKPPSHTTENFNYSGILGAESEGLALIEEGNNWFCPLRGENVSILRRSGCPPPVGGDKRPLHCGCLICVTALVCAEIDVAFHAAESGSAGGGGLFLRTPISHPLGALSVAHISKHEGFALDICLAFVPQDVPKENKCVCNDVCDLLNSWAGYCPYSGMRVRRGSEVLIQRI